MSKTTHVFRVAEARRFKHPVFEKVEKHYFLVRAIDLPPDVRMDANARDPVGLNRQVYRDVRESLMGNDAALGAFDLMNKGITIIADSIRRLDDETYEVTLNDGQGIVDGGHTYQLICEAQQNPDLPPESHVEVQIRTGVDRDLITDISRGLNTGMQVKSHSIANLDGKFDWIKLELENEKYYDQISWRESDKGDYDVRDLICILEGLNVIDFPNDSGQHPIQAYEKWSVPALKYAKDFDEANGVTESKYYKLGAVLKEALYLYDVIRYDFRSQWNKIGGSAGKLKIMEEASGSKVFQFPFSNSPAAKYRLTKGALYPIFAAFRNAVELDPKTGRARWKGSFNEVLELWSYSAPELCRTTKAAIEDHGNHPNVIGKNRGHWANNHKTLELMMLRREVAMAGKSKKKKA